MNADGYSCSIITTASTTITTTTTKQFISTTIATSTTVATTVQAGGPCMNVLFYFINYLLPQLAVAVFVQIAVAALASIARPDL